MAPVDGAPAGLILCRYRSPVGDTPPGLPAAAAANPPGRARRALGLRAVRRHRRAPSPGSPGRGQALCSGMRREPAGGLQRRVIWSREGDRRAGGGSRTAEAPGVIAPSTTGCAAPVQEGTLPAMPCHVRKPRTAKA